VLLAAPVLVVVAALAGPAQRAAGMAPAAGLTADRGVCPAG
jgi:hypothetical protein